MAGTAYMKEWSQICAAYCRKIGATLLFVNTDNFGLEMPDGSHRHIYADELTELLEREGTSESAE